MGQERVLLRAVQAMDLVEEQHRAAALALRAVDHGADLLHARGDRGERLEVGADCLREQPRDRRLAGAGRTPEDQRRQRARVHERAQTGARREQLRLPDHLVEPPRPHALRERRRRRPGSLRSLGNSSSDSSGEDMRTA